MPGDDARPPTKNPRRASDRAASTPHRRLRPLSRSSARVGERWRCRATSSATATTILGARRALPRARRASWPRRRCAARAARNDLWGGSFEVDALRPLAVPRRGVERPRRHLARRAAAQGRRRPGRPRRASSARARSCSAGAAAKGDDVEPRSRSTARRRAARRALAPTARRSPLPTSAPRCEPVEVDVDASARASAPGTSSSRAPWAASRACAEVAAAARRARLRRRLPAADPPDRHAPSARARNNTLRGQARATPAARGRSARGRRPRRGRIPSSARSTTSTRSSRRRSEHGIEIALDFAIQCSPDHPWLTEHPEWFHHRPDGTIKYAENPPKKYQDIYTVNFESRGLARASGTRCCDVVLLWIGHGVRVFRVDNPHTKPMPFWEWLIARGARRAPRRDLPRRGVHRAGDDARRWPRSASARATRTSRGEHALGARASTSTSWPRDRPTTSGPTSSPTRPTSSRVPRSTAAAPAFEARLVLAATLSPDATASTRATSTSRTCRSATGSEEYLDSEKYELKAARARRAAAAAGPAAERGPPRAPGAAAARNLTFLDTAQRRV